MEPETVTLGVVLMGLGVFVAGALGICSPKVNGSARCSR